MWFGFSCLWAMLAVFTLTGMLNIIRGFVGDQVTGQDPMGVLLGCLQFVMVGFGAYALWYR